jgi:TIR domain
MKREIFVFISYSRREKEFVDRLSDDLRANGVRIWRDVEQIEAGSNWEQEIKKSLTDATAMIFVASKNSVSSAWMETEVQFFLAGRGQVIPIVVDDQGASQMPAALAAIQWVDFRSDYSAALSKLLSALPRLLREGQPVAGSQTQTKGYVFFNYSEEDTRFIQKVRKFLGQRGYAYWDYQDSDRDYHSDLDLELEAIIREATAVLSILSPSWKASRWTRKEYLFAEEVGTPVFLLKAKELGPTLIIAGSQFIDFTSESDSGFRKLGRELERKGL